MSTRRLAIMLDQAQIAVMEARGHQQEAQERLAYAQRRLQEIGDLIDDLGPDGPAASNVISISRRKAA